MGQGFGVKGRVGLNVGWGQRCIENKGTNVLLHRREISMIAQYPESDLNTAISVFGVATQSSVRSGYF